MATTASLPPRHAPGGGGAGGIRGGGARAVTDASRPIGEGFESGLSPFEPYTGTVELQLADSSPNGPAGQR
eukprot:329888-Chlamydomonas_euryale.AAC.1